METWTVVLLRFASVLVLMRIIIIVSKNGKGVWGRGVPSCARRATGPRIRSICSCWRALCCRSFFLSPRLSMSFYLRILSTWSFISFLLIFHLKMNLREEINYLYLMQKLLILNQIIMDLDSHYQRM